MRLVIPLLLFAAFALTRPTPLHAQRWLSVGLAAGLPATDTDVQHGMLTLEVGPRRMLSRFRADLALYDVSNQGQVAQAAGSVIVPFIDRPLTPYLIAGIAFTVLGPRYSPKPINEGMRAGLGLRYRVDGRTLFAESVRHRGANRTLLTIGVQF